MSLFAGYHVPIWSNPRIIPPFKSRSLNDASRRRWAPVPCSFIAKKKNKISGFHLSFKSSQSNPRKTAVPSVHEKGGKFPRACGLLWAKGNMSIGGRESREEVRKIYLSTNERPSRTKEGQTRELRFGPALLYSSGEHKLDNLEREEGRYQVWASSGENCFAGCNFDPKAKRTGLFVFFFF